MEVSVMNPLYKFVVVSLIAIALVVIGSNQTRSTAASEVFVANDLTVVAGEPQQSVISGFDFSSIDRSVSACQDFNQFANGGWIARNPIPGAYSVWGRFTQLDEQNLNVLHTILDDLLKKKTLKGNEQKIADFYGACMDEQKIEAEGIKPLEPELQRIGRIFDMLCLEDEITTLHLHR